MAPIELHWCIALKCDRWSQGQCSKFFVMCVSCFPEPLSYHEIKKKKVLRIQLVVAIFSPADEVRLVQGACRRLSFVIWNVTRAFLRLPIGSLWLLGSCITCFCGGTQAMPVSKEDNPPLYLLTGFYLQEDVGIGKLCRLLLLLSRCHVTRDFQLYKNASSA